MYKICSKKIGQVLLNIDFMIKKTFVGTEIQTHDLPTQIFL